MRSEIVQLWFDCLTVVCFKYRDLSGNRQEIRVPAITKGIYSGTPFGASKLHFGATIRSMLWSKPRLWSENFLANSGSEGPSHRSNTRSCDSKNAMCSSAIIGVRPPPAGRLSYTGYR